MSGGPISWFSQRQGLTALSTTESEYIAACETVKGAVWLNRLLSDIQHRCVTKTEFFIDNQSAIKLIKNPEFHKRTKHINVKYHFIREKYCNGEILPLYVNTQLADLFTKSLPRVTLERLRSNLNLLPIQL